jgi:hypothetical protein
MKKWRKEKKRRHHNNKGYRQIKRGKTKAFIKKLAKELGIPYKEA